MRELRWNSHHPPHRLGRSGHRHRRDLRIMNSKKVKGGTCRDCGARYNRWQALELQPRPKFTGGAPQGHRSGSKYAAMSTASVAPEQSVSRSASGEPLSSPTARCCAACRSQVPDDARYCPKCGEPVQVTDRADSWPKHGPRSSGALRNLPFSSS